MHKEYIGKHLKPQRDWGLLKSLWKVKAGKWPPRQGESMYKDLQDQTLTAPSRSSQNTALEGHAVPHYVKSIGHSGDMAVISVTSSYDMCQ